MQKPPEVLLCEKNKGQDSHLPVLLLEKRNVPLPEFVSVEGVSGRPGPTKLVVSGQGRERAWLPVVGSSCRWQLRFLRAGIIFPLKKSYLFKRIENICPCKNLYTNVRRSMIYKQRKQSTCSSAEEQAVKMHGVWVHAPREWTWNPGH